MKKIIFILTVFLLWSCSEEDIPNNNTISGEEYVTAKLTFGGEILSIAEEPMTKALDNDDLTGIQIYAVSESGEETPYACGLFDDVSNITVKLKKGQEYVFEATSVIDGKNIINMNSEGYLDPFYLIYGNNWNTCSNITNKIDISSFICFSYLSNSFVWVLESGNAYNFSKADKFYTREKLSISDNSDIKLSMNRVGFGLKIIPINLNEGMLIVESESMAKIEIGKDETFDEVYTMPLDYNSSLSDENWKKDDYSIEKTLGFIYQNEQGEKEQIASQKIKFTRNKKTVIEVNIPSEDNPESVSSGLKVSIDDGEMEEYKPVTIE